MEFDAVLLLSFGGPEAPEQVRPFLENVTRGRNVPPERLDHVAAHYMHFGGVSPINEINRALVAQLQAELDLPVYFGNRNWEPYVEDTVATMRDNGVRRAAVFATSAWSGYSSCTQYSEDIDRARRAAGPEAPELVKLRRYFDHPLFVEMFADNIAAAEEGRKAVIVCPIGFVSDHIEVVWDLDTELRAQADAAGIAYARASTPNADRRFARLAIDLIDELRYDRAPVRVSGPDPVPGCAASINGEPCRAPHCVAEQRADRSAG